MSNVDEQSAQPAKGLSAPVVTAIVGGIVTILTVLLQTVIAPMLTRNTQSASAQPAKAELSAQLTPPAEGSGGSAGEITPARLFRALPGEPLAIAPLDRSMVTLLAVRRLSGADVQELNCWQLRVLRNVPPAFHGHVYRDVALDQLFRAQAWYRPGTETALSGVEAANVSFLQRVERERLCSVGGS